MAVTLRFDRLGTKKGEDGFWLAGKDYGQSRMKHQFYSFAAMRDAFQAHPQVASNPDGLWLINRQNAQGGTVREAVFKTQEVHKALADKFNATAEKLDAAMSRQQAKPYLFTVITRDENGQDAARFMNGRSERVLTAKTIRDMLDPERSMILVESGVIGAGEFFPERELIKASGRLQQNAPAPVSVPLDRS